MEKDGYADLIARLEKATGPDRELDIALATECMPEHHSGRWSVVTAPEFTRSIDAALTLAPETLPAHSEIVLEIEGDHSHAWAAIQVRGEYEGEETTIAEGDAPTLAIAACICFIRAAPPVHGCCHERAERTHRQFAAPVEDRAGRTDPDQIRRRILQQQVDASGRRSPRRNLAA